MREPLDSFAARIKRKGEIVEFLHGLIYDHGISPTGLREMMEAAIRVKGASDKKVARELLTLANSLTADGRRGQFLDVANGIESLRQKFTPLTSDEAIFLSIIRNIAVHIGRGNSSRVVQLAHEIEDEFGRTA